MNNTFSYVNALGVRMICGNDSCCILRQSKGTGSGRKKVFITATERYEQNR
jgi:hypothetical protein